MAMIPLLVARIVEGEVGDGLADNYLTYIRFVKSTSVAVQVQRDQIGYNRDDVVVLLQHNASILLNETKSLFLGGFTSTAYQNTSGNTAFVIVSGNIAGTGVNARFKLYSAPTTDSKAGATEVFDSDDIVSSWNAVSSRTTSFLVPIQDNHFIVFENLSVSAQPMNVPLPDLETFYAVVIEPAA